MTDTYLFYFDSILIKGPVFRIVHHRILKRLLKTVNEIELQKLINETKDKEYPALELCKKMMCEELYYEQLREYLVDHDRNNELKALFDKVHACGKKAGIVTGYPEKIIKVFLNHNLIEPDHIFSGDIYRLHFWLKIPKEFLFICDNEQLVSVAKKSGDALLVKKGSNLSEFAF